MALNNPSSLYSGGVVNLDSTPATNYYLNTNIRNNARRDAVDKYYQEMSKSLTPTGMVGDDVNDFMAKKNAWQQDAIQNKEILNNPKDARYGEAVMRNNYLFNDAQNHAISSVSRGNDIKEFGSFVKEGHPLTEDAIKEQEKLGVTIANGYQRPDISKVAYDHTKPYGYAEHYKTLQNQLKGVSVGSEITDVKPNGKNQMSTITTHFEYSPKAVEGIINKGNNLYNSSMDEKNYVDNTLNDETHFNLLNPIFKQATGRDIESGGDRLAAEMLLQGKQEYDKQTTRGYNQFQGQGGAAAKVDAGNDWVKRVTAAFKGGDNQSVKNIVGELFSGNTNYQLEPDGYRILDNGDLAITARPKGTDKYGAANPAEQLIVNPNDVNLQNKLFGWYQKLVGSDAPGEKKSIGGGAINPPSKTYKFNGKTISSDAVKKAADASGMTVEDYIKKAGIQ